MQTQPFLIKAAAYGLQKVAKDIMNKVQEEPTAEAILQHITENYAPDLNDYDVRLDDDLSDYNKFQKPWSTLEKVLYSHKMLDGIANKAKKEKMVEQLNGMFDQPRFTGMDTGLDWMKLGLDLEQKYGVDLSDLSGPFYTSAPTLKNVLAALKNAPKVEV